MVTNLTVSDVTWDSFNVHWTPEDGEFESFVIEVTNLEGGPESENLTLSADALNLGISGLSPNTLYRIGLYGLHQGSFQEPVYTEVTTGTYEWRCPPRFCPYPSLSYFFFTVPFEQFLSIPVGICGEQLTHKPACFHSHSSIHSTARSKQDH